MNWCDFDKSKGQSNGCRFSAILGDVHYNLRRIDNDQELSIDESIVARGEVVKAAWDRLLAAEITNE